MKTARAKWLVVGTLVLLYIPWYILSVKLTPISTYLGIYPDPATPSCAIGGGDGSTEEAGVVAPEGEAILLTLKIPLETLGFEGYL